MMSTMTPSANVQRLAAAVQQHLGDGPFPPMQGWNHMGAVICDSAMHGVLNYDRVIRPRLVALQEAWPDGDTVTGFRTRLATGDVAKVLKFRNARKLATIPALADHLADAGVETRWQLAAWLEDPDNRAGLRRKVRGVGPKTVDYMGGLVGRPAIAIDVHLRNFAGAAGVTATTYEDLRAVYEETADYLGHDRGGLDHAVWRHMSKRGETGKD
jgi:hypothetical protein